MADQLIHLIYASQAKGISLSDLQNLLAKAKPFNEQNSITGALIYGKGSFLQVLEGPSTQVNHCYHQRIVGDKRHHNLCLLCVESVDNRLFSEWSMGLVRLDILSQEQVDLFALNSVFQPSSLTPKQAKELLLTIAQVKKSAGVIQ